ncbi:MAG: Do family serine endopeptidase [Rickettsiales bacterium]|nr:Do family serine endopeptidase [Rickettsiales bacterium]
MFNKFIRLIISFNFLFFSFNAGAKAIDFCSLNNVSFSNIVEKLTPTVVNISTSQTITYKGSNLDDLFSGMPNNSPFKFFFKEYFDNSLDQDKTETVTSLGSGFIISEDGYIVTNNHVVEKADIINVKFNNDKILRAKLIGTDPRTDIALLKIDSDEKLPYVNFGDSDSAKVGDWVIAIGNPFGLGGTVTAGIISARGRNIGNSNAVDFIQTDAAINKGNSGGPMFDSKGNLIGINTAIFSTSGNGGSIGIGFAIPTNIAASVINQLKNTGQVVRGWLGVNVQYVSPNMAEAMGMKEMQGAYVVKVEEDSPAAKAKIKEDDIIISFDGKKIKNVSDLPRIVGNTEVGKLVKLTVLRNEKGELVEKELIVKIAQLVEKDSNENNNSEEHVEQTEYLGFKLLELTDVIRSKYKLSENIEGILILGYGNDSKNKDSGFIAGDIIIKLNQESVSDLAKFKKIVEKQKKDGKKYILLTVKRNNMTIVSTVNIE